jgi:hypothetical protein
MFSKIKLLSSVSAILGALPLAVALPAYALTIQTAPSITLTPQDTVNSLCAVVNWLFYILIVFSVIMVLIAGYRYLTSNGDPEKVSTATKTITYAAIAIVVALIAKGFPALIGSFFSVPNSTTLTCS